MKERQAWACKHKDRKHQAKGLCAPCYSTSRRTVRLGRKGPIPKMASRCAHTDRRQLAKGLCASCYNRDRKGKVPASCHPLRPVTSKGLCNACYKARQREDPSYVDRKKAWQRAWYARNKQRARQAQRESRLKCQYGLTPQQFSEMVTRQGGACIICRVPGKKLNIDHCHTTGKVRGILCHGCNTIVGAIERASSRHYRYLGGGL